MHDRDNLSAQGYDTWKAVALKPAGSTLSTVAYKSGARADDREAGLSRSSPTSATSTPTSPAATPTRAFKLPNPFYFLP